MQSIVEIFPFAHQTQTSIENQNRFLKKISLTGKINALDDTVNLFTYTDSTIEKFEQIKIDLIDALVEENIKKYRGELGFKASLAIDVLKRNLFERTADVGFLATDHEIISFLQGQLSKDEMISRLKEYIAKYSVYDDIALVDVDGSICASIQQKSPQKTSDSIIREALKSDSYIERYAPSDIFDGDKPYLLYAQKIVEGHQAIGVLVLKFKFEDELRGIFSSMAEENQVLALSDERGVIATSNSSFIPIEKPVRTSSSGDVEIYRNRYICFAEKTTGYQGYFGLDWTMYAFAHGESSTSTTKTAYKKEVLSDKIKAIIHDAHEAVEDLGDVIINGELLASKNRVYTLTPILENLRNVSSALVEDINRSAENLANLNTQSLVSMVENATKFSIEVMDRNLYERANDSRWWAMTSAFEKELSSKSPDREKLTNILEMINALYTVYTNIFIYDKSGDIIAASQDHSIVGQKFSASYLSSLLHNRDSQKYFVSGFEKSPYYHDKPTYIYNASICHEDDVVGGVGVVFDSDVEFRAILEDSFLEGQQGFSLFCDDQKRIISSHGTELDVLEKIDLPDRYFRDEVVVDFINYHDKSYLLCVAPSHGYREYKREDGYKNPLFALSFIEV